jgi:hypothetical protein
MAVFKWKSAMETFEEFVSACFFKIKGRVQNYSKEFDFGVRRVVYARYLLHRVC